MLEPVLLAWGILGLGCGVLFMFLLKKAKRSKDKYMMFHVLGLLVVSFLLSWGTYILLLDSPHVYWVSRLVMLAIGVLNVWVLFARPWSIRHSWDKAQDSLWIEAVFSFICGFTSAAVFITVPQVLELVDYSVDLTVINWDLPLVFVLPYFIFKMFDIGGHIPFVLVEAPFYYTIEEVHPQDWEWVELQQFNFQLKASLIEDHDLFTWPNKPWVEAPKNKTLQELFKLVVQERRKRKDLATLQDFGDEYAGKPEFCWVFYIKNPWYNVVGWFRKRKFLDPRQTMAAQEIRAHDVIVAQRIPAIDNVDPSWLNTPEEEGPDPNATVIIQR